MLATLPFYVRYELEKEYRLVTMNQQTAEDTETVLVMNPESGRADHTNKVRNRAALMDYTLAETEREGHAVELARQAAQSGVDEIIAVGGDGTLNETVGGIDAAGKIEETTVGIIPTGNGNDFASQLGITGIEDGFSTIRSGRQREIDIGTAGERPFLDSCLAGISPKARTETSTALTTHLGALAYVLTTLRSGNTSPSIELTADVKDDHGSTAVWDGSATVVLVGNGRRFSLSGTEPTNIENGLLDVAVIEEAETLDVDGNRLAEQILHGEETNLTRFLASSVKLSVRSNENVSFSLDGELTEAQSLTLTTKKQALTMYVGEDYEQPF